MCRGVRLCSAPAVIELQDCGDIVPAFVEEVAVASGEAAKAAFTRMELIGDIR